MKRFLIAVLALIMPMMVLAEQGAIIGYYQSWRGFPTDAQLDKLTHVILFQIYPGENGNGLVTDWWSYKDADVKTFVDKAHQKGKKVIVAAGGSGGATGNFMNATSDANRSKFVKSLTDFVNKHNLDGIDLDWETQVDWERVLDLCLDLKNAMPNKRISVTIGADSPYCAVGNHFAMSAAVLSRYQREVWKLDAVQLMTYDMGGKIGDITWNGSADAEASIQVINNWATFGQGQSGFSKEKIFIGIHMNQDNAAASTRKAGYTRQNGFGGAILWEINNNILDPAYAAIQAAGGYVGDESKPDPTRFNIPGNITVCDYEKINGAGQCEGTNIGYLENGSSVDYLIKVTQGAGSYKIKMKTANGGTAAQTVSITGGGSISVPVGTAEVWDAYIERETDIQLNNGDQTLKISVTGAVNFKDISIAKNSVVEPCTHDWEWVTTLQPRCDADGIKVERCTKCGETRNETVIPKAGNCPEPSEYIELFDNDECEWEDQSDASGGVANTVINTQKPLDVTLNISGYSDADGIYPSAAVAAYPFADFSELTKIEVTYTSNGPVQIGIVSSVPYDDYTVTYYATLIESESPVTASINLSQFSAPEYMWNADWGGKLPANQRYLSDIGTDKIEGVVFYLNNDLAGISGFRESNLEITVSSLKLFGSEWKEDPGETPIKPYQKIDGGYGIMFKKRVVSEKAEIFVNTPEKAAASILIYDMTGNVIFSEKRTEGKEQNEFVWDLRNNAGRLVAAGTYLVVVEAKANNVTTYRYSAKLGVKQ